MHRLKRTLLLLCLLLPFCGHAAECQLEAQLQGVQIQNCGGDRLLGAVDEQGALVDPVPFDAIPLGLEKFWVDLCRCDMWQVSGITGAHTRIVNFYRVGSKGTLVLAPGGEFGSVIGKISRLSQRSGFIVEVRDSDAAGKRQTRERYRFDRKRFVRLRAR